MKIFEWNAEKNILLKKDRGISFEEIVFSIEQGLLLDVILHPNKGKYPQQKILIVNIDNYAYLVPFIETAHIIFLKTIIPSRKATQKYLSGGNHETQ